DFMPQFSGVRNLYLHNAYQPTSLHPLTRLEKLTHIFLQVLKTDPVPTISALNQTPSIYVNGMPGRVGLLRDIAAARPTLTRFGISRDTNLSSIEELESMAELKALGLTACPVSGIDVLAGLRKLTSVQLSGTKVTNVRPLTTLPELRRLDLRGCPPELDLSPLSALPRRIDVILHRGQRVLGLDAARPQVRIQRW